MRHLATSILSVLVALIAAVLVNGLTLGLGALPSVLISTMALSACGLLQGFYLPEAARTPFKGVSRIWILISLLAGASFWYFVISSKLQRIANDPSISVIKLWFLHDLSLCLMGWYIYLLLGVQFRDVHSEFKKS
ncbi:hypothetical protein [Salinarimonas soli]|uniref:Uncharacterized protein n=1 Tax=Salinarimonas soli TaxID=1638099 RepID=A0A5B2V651_9HYPH|nr:hypothetical protein [Salinarimonas soli]KAA2234396.1 hypothetical protein F0L46_24110 [Salinarimonas soli]